MGSNVERFMLRVKMRARPTTFHVDFYAGGKRQPAQIRRRTIAIEHNVVFLSCKLCILSSRSRRLSWPPAERNDKKHSCAHATQANHHFELCSSSERRYTHTEVVRLLVAAGANVAAKNAQGKSVRQLADQCRSTAVIAALTTSAV